MKTEPPIVSSRNHFTSTLAVVEQFVERYWPEEGISRADAEEVLLSFANSVVRSVAMNFATAAERGINQAAELIQDPAYFETISRRRKREMVQNKEEAEKAKQAAAARKLFPTPEQVEQERARLRRSIDYSQRDLARYQKSLMELESGQKSTGIQ